MLINTSALYVFIDKNGYLSTIARGGKIKEK